MHLRRVVAVVATPALALVCPAASGAASERSVDDRCPAGAIPASAVARVSGLGCSLVGRTIRSGPVSVVVPPAGVGVAGEGVSTRGDLVGLRVTNTGHGVTARTGTEHSGGASAAVAGRVSSPPACQDRAFNLEGHRWRTSYRYHLNLVRMPDRYSARAVVRQVKAANHHLRTGDNTCGRAAIATPGASYLGRTTRRANITTSGTTVGCGSYNTRNVVAFGDLPGNLLGWTCFWWVTGGRINAADVVMDTGEEMATRLPADCVDRWDFEGAVTHEMGHVYGLGHTGAGHANLTMHHLLRPCSSYARTLGLGDWLGLKKMYGVR